MHKNSIHKSFAPHVPNSICIAIILPFFALHTSLRAWVCCFFISNTLKRRKKLFILIFFVIREINNEPRAKCTSWLLPVVYSPVNSVWWAILRGRKRVLLFPIAVWEYEYNYWYSIHRTLFYRHYSREGQIVCSVFCWVLQRARAQHKLQFVRMRTSNHSTQRMTTTQNNEKQLFQQCFFSPLHLLHVPFFLFVRSFVSAFVRIYSINY